MLIGVICCFGVTPFCRQLLEDSNGQMKCSNSSTETGIVYNSTKGEEKFIVWFEKLRKHSKQNDFTIHE